MENIFSSNNLDFLAHLGVALVCGLLVGIERERRGKPAGISTQTLVVAGAMLFSYISHQVGGDPTRIAAQIVSGIGFLGAGIILKSEKKQRVNNVTTAAAIWFSAALGMLVGFGFFFMAIVSAVFAVVVSRIPHINKEENDD